MFVKPAASVEDPTKPRLVRFGRGLRLPDQGAEVDETDLFWARRLQDGDVLASQPTAETATTPEQRKQQAEGQRA